MAKLIHKISRGQQPSTVGDVENAGPEEGERVICPTETTAVDGFDLARERAQAR
jgi:hypothetical protein